MDNVEFEVRPLLAKGKKIEAIKTVRRLTGMNLTEAKAYVDSLEKPDSPHVSQETLEAEVRLLLLKKRKIEAVKKVREMTGWGLKESKDFVDNLQS